MSIELLKRAAAASLVVPGAPVFTVVINNRTISGSQLFSGTAIAGWRADTSARARKEGIGPGVGWENIAGEWLQPLSPTEADLYAIKATELNAVGAATRTGILNTWLGLSVDRIWTISTSTGGLKDWGLQFDIALLADLGDILDTADVQLLVEVIL